MRLRDCGGWIEAILLVAAMVWISFVIGFAMGGSYVRDDAVRHGSAWEWIDPETGAERFEWK